MLPRVGLAAAVRWRELRNGLLLQDKATTRRGRVRMGNLAADHLSTESAWTHVASKSVRLYSRARDRCMNSDSRDYSGFCSVAASASVAATACVFLAIVTAIAGFGITSDGSMIILCLVIALSIGVAVGCVVAPFWIKLVNRRDLHRFTMAATAVSLAGGWLVGVVVRFYNDLVGLVVGVIMAFGVILLGGLIARLFTKNTPMVGYCPSCRYDLRGSEGFGCPECGWNRPPNEGQRPPQAESPSAEAPSSPDSSGTESPPNAPPPSPPLCP